MPPPEVPKGITEPIVKEEDISATEAEKAICPICGTHLFEDEQAVFCPGFGARIR